MSVLVERGTASGAVLDGTQKNVATFAGIAVSMLAGSRIAKKPKIKAFLSKSSTLWFLFLFNGGVAAFCYLTMDGVKGIATAAGMGLVSLGAAAGLLANRRKPTTAADQPQARTARFRRTSRGSPAPAGCIRSGLF
ncbi:hypothetical protein [Streptomyces sp. NBC_00986]|uniref:hypothetical protein n=1 Tax=Streptomyces sp. NBC_00986 TaxID=2903702 RepID=UPI00386C682F|nr:hypothetical protein OG504_02550 [Streptomyces sp. NBC_00986]